MKNKKIKIRHKTEIVCQLWARQSQSHAKSGTVSFLGYTIFYHGRILGKLMIINGLKIALIGDTPCGAFGGGGTDYTTKKAAREAKYLVIHTNDFGPGAIANAMLAAQNDIYDSLANMAAYQQYWSRYQNKNIKKHNDLCKKLKLNQFKVIVPKSFLQDCKALINARHKVEKSRLARYQFYLDYKNEILPNLGYTERHRLTKAI